jgi:hypothetical protein
METIRDLLGELLSLDGSEFHVQYEGHPLRRLADLDEEAWMRVIIGLGAIRQLVVEAEARAIELWSKRWRPEDAAWETA